MKLRDFVSESLLKKTRPLWAKSRRVFWLLCGIICLSTFASPYSHILHVDITQAGRSWPAKSHCQAIHLFSSWDLPFRDWGFAACRLLLPLSKWQPPPQPSQQPKTTVRVTKNTNTTTTTTQNTTTTTIPTTKNTSTTTKVTCHLRFSGIRPLRGYPPPS